MCTFRAISDRLLETMNSALPALGAIDDQAASEPRAPGKWSHKQTLGHLVDSAANNHQRFVRAQQNLKREFPAYDQDHWVNSQAYNSSSWKELIGLWYAYNRHLAHVMALIPEQIKDVRCTIGANEPITLEFLASDYVEHMRHHLRQIGITF